MDRFCQPTQFPASCPGSFLLLFSLLMAPLDAAAQEEGSPSWLETEMAREVDQAPAAVAFRLSDTVGGSVPAALGAKAYNLNEKIHSFELNFGADQTARCFLWETELSVAGLLDRQTQQVKAGLGENTQWRVFGFDADAARGIPLLGVRWLYQIETEEQTNVGLFKMYAAAPGATTLLCFHDRLGYIESFGSMFRALVAGLDVPPSEDPAPDTRDVSIITMFDMKVGYVEDSFTRVGDEMQVVSESAMLVPTSASDILSSDEASVELSALDGRLISAIIAEGPSLEISTRLEVDQTKDGEWKVTGIREGEDFEARFSGEPMSQYGTILLARQAVNDPDSRTITFPRWDDNEPGQISTATVTINEVGPPVRATMNMQGLEATATLDEEGRAITIRMEADGVGVAIDRIFKEGSLPEPANEEPPF